MNNSSDGDKTKGSRSRRRGRRRRGRGQDAGQRQEQRQPQQAQAQPQPPAQVRQEPEALPRESRERPGAVEPSRGPQRSDRGDRGGRNRRRSSRGQRPMMEMETGEVLREPRGKVTPVQPMRKRRIVEDDTSEPMFGCPMLTRTRLALPFRGNQNAPRCSVGWAVHDEDEVLFCMHTPSRNLCWKENPEQFETLVEKLRPVIEAELSEDGSAAD